ncbi:MAG: hypothetical protein JW956_14605 [Calditrichaceae bacterium]|nr:hypothetical protein [Calditrichaceae bacterium]
MNCEYILQNEIHEKFLRGLLSEDQKAEYELHLKQCESCRTTFENEKALFEGIQSAGQQAMKLEIERQVEKLREEHTGADWTLIFKVAAVLFFLVIMPGTLYFLNTDLFTKKAEPASEEKIDRMAGVKLEEAEPVEQSEIQEDTEEEDVRGEIAGGKKEKVEKSFSTSREKKVTTDIKDEISLSEKTDDVESLQNILGRAEGSAASKENGLGGVGSLEAASKQTVPEPGRDRRATAASIKSKKAETDKMERRAPALRSDASKMAADEAVKQQETVEFSDEKVVDSEPAKITLYELLPTEPIMLQKNYLGEAEEGFPKKAELNTLNFSSGYKQIIANVAPPVSDLNEKSEGRHNKSFKIILISKTQNLINMNWYPQFDVRAFQPNKISIKQTDDSYLLINFNQKYLYKVDISKDTTEAVLQE